MNKFNPENERIKRKYIEWISEAQRKSEATVTQIIRNINKFERFTDCQDFKKFNKQKAIDYKKELLNTRSTGTEKFLSASTVLTAMNHIQDFFSWLSYQPGYKSRIDLNDIEYFNLSAKETRIGQDSPLKKYPSLEIISKVIQSMPYGTDIEKRDRALISFTILTGIRDGAITSLKLKHVHLEDGLIDQDPKDVKTKFSKHIITYFFPVGEEIKQIFIDWVNFLYSEKMYDNSYPIFPRTRIIQDINNCYMSDGMEPEHWCSAQPIREIFKKAFFNSGIDYYSPHSFRNTLVNLGEKVCKTPEDFKAWSQNLGHESPLTTFTSYGVVSPYRQGDIIKNLMHDNREGNDLLHADIRKIIELLKNKN